MAVARYYDEEKNPQGAHFGGVPLTDLTEEEFDALPKHVKADVDASPFYRKSKVGTEAPKKKSGKKKRAKSPAEKEAAGIERLNATIAENLTEEPVPAPEGEEE